MGETSAATGRTRTIDVRVRADFEELAMLRAVVETVALFADFGIDRVTDIRLALEEIATALVQDTVDNGELECCFDYGPTSMLVRICATTISGTGPDRHSLGWHIVSTLTEDLTVHVEPYDERRRGHRTIIETVWSSGGNR